MLHQHFIPVLFLCAAAAIAVLLRKLTIAGGIAGAIVATLIYAGTGYTGISLLAAFFILGVGATSVGRKTKERRDVAEGNKGQRTAGQVLANGGIAAVAGAIALLYPFYSETMLLAVAGSLASATADTMSSELGMIYGSRYYNILTWKRDRCGENGVISLEGTLIGILGSSVIAIIYALGTTWNTSVAYIIIGGTAGNLMDSLLGATLERKGHIGNNAVNALNTLTGAVVACLR